jgi:hypothetical protein
MGVRDLRGRRNGAPEHDERAVLEELVGRLEARLIARESGLAARERDLQAAIAELREAQAASARDEAALSRRERALDARVAMVTRRELELTRRAAELECREREAGKAAPEPEPSPAPRAEGYNLVTLERLVESRAAEFPDRADEWASYLYFLREHAAADGSLPAALDGLIGEAFAELVL